MNPSNARRLADALANAVTLADEARDNGNALEAFHNLARIAGIARMVEAELIEEANRSDRPAPSLYVRGHNAPRRS